MPPPSGTSIGPGNSKKKKTRPYHWLGNGSPVPKSPLSSNMGRLSDGGTRQAEARKCRIASLLLGMMFMTSTLLFSASFTAKELLGAILFDRPSACGRIPCLHELTRTGNVSFGMLAYIEEVAKEEAAAAECSKPSENYLLEIPQKNNGYLLVRLNGGLNQMRGAICDMVAVARALNVTMVVPELDKTSFWADPSDFGDIFDVQHFIKSLSKEVRIIHKLPAKYRDKEVFSMDPVSWSSVNYYKNVIAPIIHEHKVLRFNHSDSRLANNIPQVSLELQKLRCRVNYHALQFAAPILALGTTLIARLRARGPFIALHLRYEMDMLSFTGCTHGCTKREQAKLTKLRMRTDRWREKVIDGDERRREGLCPLTPEEVAVMLRAMGYKRSTQIYIASGKIYGGKRRMAQLLKLFPNAVRKEMLATEEELAAFKSHSSQMAGLDYMVSVASDVFLSTFDGNMARLVEGHRRYLGHKRTIIPDRKKLVALFEEYEEAGVLSWKELSRQVQEAHMSRMGQRTERVVLSGRPKEEDNFLANPIECMCPPTEDERQPEELTLQILPEPGIMKQKRLLKWRSDGGEARSRSKSKSTRVGRVVETTLVVQVRDSEYVRDREEAEPRDDADMDDGENGEKGGGDERGGMAKEERARRHGDDDEDDLKQESEFARGARAEEEDSRKPQWEQQ